MSSSMSEALRTLICRTYWPLPSRIRCGSFKPRKRYASAMRIALALTIALAACSSTPTTSRVSTKDAPKLLIDRNWMDRMPETDRDKLFVYRFVPKRMTLTIRPRKKPVPS